MEFVCDLPDGHSLFKRKEPHGGHSFWTSHVGGGVCVYDEGLSEPLAMFYAIDHLGFGRELWLSIGEALGYTAPKV